MKQQIVNPLCAFALFASTICCVSSRAASEEATPKTAPTTETKQTADANIEYLKVVEDYSLRVKAKETYAPSEAIFLDVALKNLGADGNVNDTGTNSPYQYDFSVMLPNGKAAPKTLYGVQALDPLQAFYSRMLHAPFKSGAVIADELQISRYFDMTLPGTYSIEIGRSVYKRHAGPRWKSVGMTTVFANPINITVR